LDPGSGTHTELEIDVSGSLENFVNVVTSIKVSQVFSSSQTLYHQLLPIGEKQISLC